MQTKTRDPNSAVERLIAEASDQVGRSRQIVVERCPFGWHANEYTDEAGGILAEHDSHQGAVFAALSFLIENIARGEIGPITITMGRCQP